MDKVDQVTINELNDNLHPSQELNTVWDETPFKRLRAKPLAKRLSTFLPRDERRKGEAQ